MNTHIWCADAQRSYGMRLRVELKFEGSFSTYGFNLLPQHAASRCYGLPWTSYRLYTIKRGLESSGEDTNGTQRNSGVEPL